MAISNFAAEVMADGPIGFWRLGEPAGSATTGDSSGNANNGSCTGGITFGQPGFHGGDAAALFDGVSGRIVVLNSNSLNPPHITMEAKVRWDGANDLYQRIVEKSSFPELAQYGFGILPDGHVHVELRTSSAPISVSIDSIAVLSIAIETHIVATYDGSLIRIYLNGVLDNQTHAPGSISPKPPTQANLVESGVGIGNQTQRNRPFKGLIDEVALYPRELPADRVLAHYRAQFAERQIHQYAAKFVCGKTDGGIVAPGTYFTAINVHNPLYAEVRFRVKAASGLPGLKPGPVSKFHAAGLGADEALEIDCPDIRKLAGHPAEFMKGFIVIESETELDVLAVYTAAGRDGQVETLHLERVPARSRKAGARETCVTFEAPLALGTEYGLPVGQHSGDVIFTTSGIAVSIRDFAFVGGGGTFNLARVDAAPELNNTQTMRLNNVCLEFDFSALDFVPTRVQLEVLDKGGSENLSVNGSPVFAGQISAFPASLGGAAVAVSLAPVPGGHKGTVTLSGAISRFMIGGQEFWIDNVCAME